MKASEIKDPCLDCPNKQVDDYGYLCDLSCGQRSAYFNVLVGIEKVLEWITSHRLIKPDKDSLTQFEPYYIIHPSELKEWGVSHDK